MIKWVSLALSPGEGKVILQGIAVSENPHQANPWKLPLAAGWVEAHGGKRLQGRPESTRWVGPATVEKLSLSIDPLLSTIY